MRNAVFVFMCFLSLNACKVQDANSLSQSSVLPAASNEPVVTCNQTKEICVSTLLTATDPVIHVSEDYLLPNLASLITQFNQREIASLSPISVNLALSIKNLSDKSIVFMSDSDGNQYNFQANGPDVLNLNTRNIFTMEYQEGTAVTLEPNQTQVIQLNHLGSGFRAASVYTYLPQEDDYRLRIDGQLSFRGANIGIRETLSILSNTIAVRVEKE